MTLTYGATVVTLRNPEWNDSVTHDPGIIQSRNRSRANRFSCPANRAVKKQLSLTSKLNKTAAITALLSLLTSAQGQLVAVVAPGISGNYLINQESVDIITAKDHCSYTVVFDMLRGS